MSLAFSELLFVQKSYRTMFQVVCNGDLMSPLIQVESISKCYRIFQNPKDRFKQALLDRFHKVFGKTITEPFYREHWALRDISFELQSGEAIGILGRNGAGKSTLLQIITGTLDPTHGSVKTNGRITALLELGSGFNPEFTGRENVILNAQLLGMSMEETLSRYDDIVSFADIGDFINEPVKTYSSGMMMRLAFAVQTAVEPKVLIVDEALSVGDMFFQAKCMARMKRLLDDGASLIFVSHDVGTVRQICGRALVLNYGKSTYFGEVSKGADIYNKQYLENYNDIACKIDQEILSIAAETHQSYLPENDVEDICHVDGPSPEFLSDITNFVQKCDFERLGNGSASFTNVCMSGQLGPTDCFAFGEDVTLWQVARFNRDLENLNVAYKIRTLQGIDVVFGDTRLFGDMTETFYKGGIYLFKWQMILNLGHGSYTITSSLSHPPDGTGKDWEFVDYVPISCQFRVLPRDQGMVDGLCVIDASLSVSRLS